VITYGGVGEQRFSHAVAPPLRSPRRRRGKRPRSRSCTLPSTRQTALYLDYDGDREHAQHIDSVEALIEGKAFAVVQNCASALHEAGLDLSPEREMLEHEHPEPSRSLPPAELPHGQCVVINIRLDAPKISCWKIRFSTWSVWQHYESDHQRAYVAALGLNAGHVSRLTDCVEGIGDILARWAAGDGEFANGGRYAECKPVE
jgi:hypothetical protein